MKLRWLLVTTLLVAAVGCQKKQEAGQVFVDPALLTLLPPDATLVAGVRVDQLIKTPLYQKRAGKGGLPLLDDFAAATGMDAARNLWQVMLVSNGPTTAVLIRGKFSSDGAEPRLQIPNSQRSSYKGYVIQGNPAMSIAFLNPSTAVAGEPDAVKAMLDGRNTAGPSAAMSAMLSTIPKSSQVWVACTGNIRVPSFVPHEGNWANAAKIAGLMRTLVGWADFSNGMTLHAQATTAGEKEARQLGGVLKGLVGLGRLSTPDNNTALLRAFDAVQVEAQGVDVRMDAALDQALADELLSWSLSVSEKVSPNPGSSIRRPR